MLLTVTTLENPGPPSPVPPPIAPKPRKDNARLQRLLRKAAKRSNVQASPTQPHKSFRSTLSPVCEADLESIEPAAPQNKQPLALNLPPRFQVRGATQRVPSPYPKQRTFTFTVVEQHSLNQYLSTSPVPDTPSPRPFPSSPLNTPFLYPPGHSTQVTSLDINVNGTPRPTTPETKLIPPKQPTESHLTISVPPIIIINEANQNSSGLISTNIDIKVDPVVLNTENGTCSTKDVNINMPEVSSCHVPAPKTPNSPLFEEQDPTSKSSGCVPLGIEDKSMQQLSTAPTPMAVDKRAVEFSRDDKVLCSTPHSSGPSKVVTEVKIINSVGKGWSEVTTKTLPAEMPVSPNIPKSNHMTSTSCTDSSTTSGKVSNSEELNLLKTPDRPKPPRKKPGGGWARLVKHLVVEPEEPKFPDPQNTEGKEEKTGSEAGATTEGTQQSKGIRANRMWDALLYHMATSNKIQEKPASSGPAPPPLLFLRSRLPLLLHRPRFDARKLKEAASRPLRRVTTFFHRRLTEKAPSSFNRVASGWSLRGDNDEQNKGEEDKIINGEVKE